MQTTAVSMRRSELMYGGLEKVKRIIEAATLEKDPLVMVIIEQNEKESFSEKLERRMDDLNNGKGITFTIEELEKYIVSPSK